MVGLVACGAWGMGRATPDLAVSLNTPRAEFVLGEPVILVVTVTNLSKEPLQQQALIVEHCDCDIAVLIARPGAEFEQYRIRRDTTALTLRVPETINPGQTRYYTLRVLYTTERPSRLAFEQSGQYRIKVTYPSYPLVVNRNEAPAQFASNTVLVRIKAPEGLDAKAWQMLRDPDVLYLLQSGLLRDERRDALRTVLHVFRAMPDSSYFSALKWSLQRHYEEQQVQTRKRRPDQYPELDEIRGALGMPEDGWGPFLEDRRLDVRATCEFGERLRLDEGLRRMSERTGVPLRVAPELGARTISGNMKEHTVRGLMDGLDGRGAAWIREDDGSYRLVPTEKFKPPDPFRATQKKN